MQISAGGLLLIKRFEGFSPTVYVCPAGYPTIGYGHVVRTSEMFWVIDEVRATELLCGDVLVAEMGVQQLIKTPLTQGQYDALVSFTYNLGAGRLEMSRLRRRVNAGEHNEVPAELMRWVYAGGRPLPGLVARRAEEGRIYKG